MRTTVRLDDRLLADAKRYAAQSGRTLTSLIDEGLRDVLARRGAPSPAASVKLPTGGSGRVAARRQARQQRRAARSHGPGAVILPDVNVLVYSYREDMAEHDRYRGWLDDVVNAGRPYGMSELVLSAFVRVVTNPRVFRSPSSPSEALSFARQLLSPSSCVPVRPGPGHWAIFDGLCNRHEVTGNLVADAYLAAIAMEAGCELVTVDRDFARFTGLRWRHPLLP